MSNRLRGQWVLTMTRGGRLGITQSTMPSRDQYEYHPVTPAMVEFEVQFCQSLLNRSSSSFTPRFRRLLNEWKKLLQEEAEGATPGEDVGRLEDLIDLRACIDRHVEMRKSGGMFTHEKMQELQNLRLMKLLLDYQDFFPFPMADDDDLRLKQVSFHTAWNRSFIGFWSNVLRVLEGDDNREDAREMRNTIRGRLKCAAREVCCTPHHLHFEIRTYNKRQRWNHSDIKYMIMNGLWVGLAYKISDDLRALKFLIPDEEQDELNRFRTAIESVERLFVKDLSHENPESHEWSEYAEGLREKVGKRIKEKQRVIRARERQAKVPQDEGYQRLVRQREASEWEEEKVRWRIAYEMEAVFGIGGLFDPLFEDFEKFSLEDCGDLWIHGKPVEE
ncbi:MAG: hypothetical protein M1823_002030 [Watsoniomyces obsoletus]|nr:MAG: hypothetical protein M1823_002030 [Watsoniomyces obsoletus]